MKRNLKFFASILFSLVLALSCLLSACSLGEGDDSGDTCSHIDMNVDGLCDLCGSSMSGSPDHNEHVDVNADGLCDFCGKLLGSTPVDPGTGGEKDPEKDPDTGDDTKPTPELKPFDPVSGTYTFGDSDYYLSKEGLLSEPFVNDKYGTFYEIGVQSFCNSDAKYGGDLQGIISRLPYLRGLGYTGIWLTPVVDAWPDQYGYGTRNYFNIYPEYGTLADFDELIEKAHSLGMKVICDMVFNHTSDSGCEWWTNSLQAQKKFDRNNYYYGFYNFRGSKPDDGSHWELRDGWYFECSQFYGGMPDLNLDNQNVRKELAKVIEFWVKDHHIDGMRLDAVRNYYNGQPAKNKAFVNWVVSEAKKYNPTSM